jgi:FKBP-type peptidyl-prolyl cis-trans isomerase
MGGFMDKQKAIIYLLVGVMLFSVIGLGIVLVFDSGSSNSQNQDDLNAQVAELEAQQEAQNQAQADIAACQALPANPSAKPLKSPEVFIPEGDVTDLEAVDLKVGEGAVVEADSCLVVNYHGTLATDGTVFDSSYERGEPAKFPLTAVITGWRQGLLGMKEGGIRRLVIPSELAYGSAGNPPVISPDADLVFVVELVSIEK